MQFLNTEEKPRRAAVINDLSGAGKCSLTVMLPVLSALGCETSVLPTAVLSTHGGFKDPVYRDLTDDMLKTAQHWKREGAAFEGICSGYLSSREQIDTVREIFELFTDEHSRPLRLVDPVMGDNGKAYATVTPELISRIRQLCRSANLILPNYTEAQLLLQRTPVDDPLDDAAAQALADELTALCRYRRRPLLHQKAAHQPQLPRHGRPVRCGAHRLPDPGQRPERRRRQRRRVRVAGHPEHPRRAGHPLRRLVRAAAAPPVPAPGLLTEDRR